MKHLARLAALLFLASPAFAQPCGDVDLFETLTPEQSSAIDAVVAETPFSSGNLWQATNGEDSVVVVGTLHVPDPRFAGMLERVAGYVADADLLILEATASDELRMMEMTAANPELFFLTDGPSLIELLGPEDWEIAAKRFENAGVPGFLAAKFRPWYAGMVIGMPACIGELVASQEVGLDRQIEAMAERNGVRVVAIEDVADVMDLLASGDDATDLENLRLVLHSGVTGGDMTATLIESYFAGRTTAAWELGRVISERDLPGQGAALFDEFSEVILKTRNRAWESDLPDLIAGRAVVLAVGAAHLPGETGVLRALERLGYEVTPLP